MNEIDNFRGKYSFLSNFFVLNMIIPIEYFSKYSIPCNREISVTTLEHIYQASKCVVDTEFEKMISLSTATETKKFGKKIKIRNDWDLIKLDIMKDLIDIKFNNNDLQSLLKETYPLELIEKNWWGDTFWGICNNKGLNNLGKILMNKRQQLFET